MFPVKQIGVEEVRELQGTTDSVAPLPTASAHSAHAPCVPASVSALSPQNYCDFYRGEGLF